MNERNNGFFCFATVYDTMRELERKDESLAYSFAKAAMEYGIYGEYDESDPIINSLMQSVMFGIDSVESRRVKNTFDGRKGGRPSKVNDQEVWELFDNGYNKNELANYFGCSVRTIERSLNRR